MPPRDVDLADIAFRSFDVKRMAAGLIKFDDLVEAIAARVVKRLTEPHPMKRVAPAFKGWTGETRTEDDATD